MNWEPEIADPKVGSFMPGLVWACENTSGPVLELGAGYFSTAYLAGLSGRLTVSYEFDPEWAEVIRRQFPGHVVEERLGPLARYGPWAVVLVDCEGWNRKIYFDLLRQQVQIFVVHDSQDDWIPEADLQNFRYRKDFGEDPKTTLVSDWVDVWKMP